MDWITRLTRKMMASAQKGMAQGMQEGMREVLDQMVKGTLDPAKIAAFAKAMGIDMSQLPGMVGQRPGFDAYQILGLDRSASDEAVKKRYNELLHVLHPDKSGTPGTSLFLQMVMAAFEMIKRERGWQ